MPATRAIAAIERGAFRVSRLMELNDPYEWSAAITPVKPEMEQLADWCSECIVNILNDMVGIICFSSTYSDGVLWSHYADGHNGICFEVEDTHDDTLHKILYTNTRPQVDPRWFIGEPQRENIDKALNAFAFRKSPGWAYEKEYRVIIELGLCNVRGGHYYLTIPPDYLRRVIIGVRCDISMSYIRTALNANGFDGVEVVKAKKSTSTYEIIC